MYDIENFVRDLGNVPSATDPRTIRAKSRDAYALSPLLRKTLQGKTADLVVSPRTKEELATVLKGAAKYKIPVTARGNGTSQYGQSVPLKGGIMLDMTAITGVLWVKPGAVRAKAGTTLDEIEEVTKPQGWELRFFPTTRKHATIGGFIAGGTGGVGSINWGVLRDRGNIRAVEVMSLEERPRLVELRGDDSRLIHHSYGAAGIVTEVEFALAPAGNWQEALVAFPTYGQALRCGVQLARESGIVKKLASVYEWPITHYVQPFRPLVPERSSIVISLIGEQSVEDFRELVASYGGKIVSESVEGEGPYNRPLYEFSFGHLNLQVQKTDPMLTEVEGLFRSDDLVGLIERVHTRLNGVGPLRMELRRWDGDLVGSGSPLINFTDEARVADIVRILQQEGVRVANPHASNVRGVGKKEIGEKDIALKRSMDPAGLLNPGRFEVSSASDAKIEKHLPTDGWVRRAS
jgi:hypothetical protein